MFTNALFNLILKCIKFHASYSALTHLIIEIIIIDILFSTTGTYYFDSLKEILLCRCNSSLSKNTSICTTGGSSI